MLGGWLLKQHGGLVDSIRVLCPSIGNNPVPSAVERDRGQEYATNMAANKNYATLLKNQSAIKYLPWMRFLSNLGCKIVFYVFYQCLAHQQDYNSLFKGSIGHVTS